jgi:SNARE associated Golgi protein
MALATSPPPCWGSCARTPSGRRSLCSHFVNRFRSPRLCSTSGRCWWVPGQSLALQTRSFSWLVCRRGRGGARPLETGYRIGLAAQKPSTTAREGLLRAVGIWAIVLARFSGPLRATVPLVAGIAEMPPLRFQIANWTSAFLWAFVLLSPGSWGVRWLLEYLR